jgi:RNA polymerase sigma factor (sigma-70 family)
MPFSNQERRPDRLNWLTEIYRAYAADLQRFIVNKIGDPMLAEDLTSMVFLKALRWLSEDQSPKSVRGWLYATARTTIVDHWQVQSQSEMRSLSGLEEQLLQSSDTAEASQHAQMRVQHLLGLLPERDRRILTLHYLEGHSAAEIAEALGTSAGHIRVLQLRALRRAAQVETMERKRYRMQEPERIHAGIVFIFDREMHPGPSGSSSAPSAVVAAKRSPASSQQRSAPLQAVPPSRVPSSVITV